MSDSTLVTDTTKVADDAGYTYGTHTQVLDTPWSKLQKAAAQPIDQSSVPADSKPIPTSQGIDNPYGRGLMAYEPNTVPYQAELAGSTLGNSSVTKSTVDMPQGSEPLDAQAPGSVPDYAGGGIHNANGQVQAFINAAMGLAAKHVPYVWGGTTASGVDCSGLIYFAAHAAGITDFKRYVSGDYGKMPLVAPDQARPGDIVYWAPGDHTDTGHVGIYLGNGKIVAAPQSGQSVTIQNIYGHPTFHRIFNDSSFGAAATPTGGTTYNYNGRNMNFVGTSGVRGGTPFANLFQSAGARYGVPANLLAAVAHQESGFNPNVSSRAGAQGLMQFMPATARSFGVNPWDPASSIDGAARYLRSLHDQFGSWELALAGYNAGGGAVQRYGGIPPYAETQNYVRSIMAQTSRYSL